MLHTLTYRACSLMSGKIVQLMTRMHILTSAVLHASAYVSECNTDEHAHADVC
jgi:predicted small secreted protein